MAQAPLRTAGIDAAREYQDLPAWQKSLALTEMFYSVDFKTPELKALVIDRAINVATRIAAASVRPSEAGIAAGYQEAQGSLAELATLLSLAERLGLEGAATYVELLEEVSRLLVAMRHGLKVKAADEARAERDGAKLDREHAERQERPRREFKPRDGDDRPRREYKPRDGGSDRPRREYKPRDGAEDRPRREYKPRDAGDAPRREYKPRDAGGEDRPRREYKPRDGASGDRKPYGDKKPYGDRKPYGDKKPYGEKKAYPAKKPYSKPFKKRDD